MRPFPKKTERWIPLWNGLKPRLRLKKGGLSQTKEENPINPINPETLEGKEMQKRKEDFNDAAKVCLNLASPSNNW